MTALALSVALACGGGGEEGGPTGPGPTPGPEPAIVSISVSPSSAELDRIGATEDFVATARDVDGNEISRASFTWSSSATSVVTVDGQGVATARSNGATTIEAEAEGVTGTASVTVRAGELAWLQLAGGPFNSCGVTTHGTVYCWGSNRHRQLGVDGASRALPVEIESDLYFEQVASSGQACALTPRGRAYCWGSNTSGELGDGTTAERPTPTPVSTSRRYRQITVGGNHTCAVTTEEAAECWGLNREGQLGDGTTTDRNSPVSVRGDRSFEQVSAAPALNPNHTCGATPEGEAYCWGPNGDGELGDGSTTLRTEPVRVEVDDVAFVQVRAGGRHSCGLTSAGDVYCWGANDMGQLGDGTTDDRIRPDRVATDLTFERIAVGRDHACGLASDGTAHCWGGNGRGQLGDESNTDRSSPVPVAGGLTLRNLQAGQNHTCGVTSTGVGYCWGANGDGQLADGTFTDRSEPVRVPAPGGAGSG